MSLLSDAGEYAVFYWLCQSCDRVHEWREYSTRWEDAATGEIDCPCGSKITFAPAEMPGHYFLSYNS